MANKFNVTSSYKTYASADVELPEGKIFADIEAHEVRWGTFKYKLRGDDKWYEVELNCDHMEIDWKRPDWTEIINENDELLYEE
jgi:hypothetical protein